MSQNDLITSKEIIDKTGISRATLNNYIKMGILPKPIVRKPGPEQKGVKQIGYFPIDVMERILKVKLLKRQGKSMDEIVNLFKEILSGDEPGTTYEDSTDEKQAGKSDIERTKNSRRIVDKQLDVTIADINSPAYLINPDIERYEDKDVIIREGNKDNDFFKLIQGGLYVVKGGKKIAEIVQPGDYFGEMSAFTRELRSASIISKGRSAVKRYPGEKLVEIIEKYPDIAKPLFEVLATRLGNTDKSFVKALTQLKKTRPV